MEALGFFDGLNAREDKSVVTKDEILKEKEKYYSLEAEILFLKEKLNTVKERRNLIAIKNNLVEKIDSEFEPIIKLNEELQDENRNLVLRLEELENDKILLDAKVNRFEKQVRELTALKAELNANLTNQVQQLAKTNIILEERAKRFEQQKEELEEEIKIYKRYRQSYEELINVVASKEEKIKEYESKLNAYQKNKNFAPKDMIPYDCVLDIENFYELNAPGWTIQINNPIIKEDILGATLSIVGMYDKGKTFLLNKLTNFEFGSSKKVTTKGLSFKMVQIEKTNFTIIDTAGYNSPINLKKIQEREKKYTEAFIQELAFGLSNYFIIVVNDFCAKDQKFLRTLAKRTESNKDKQSIIVVHNFKDIEEQDFHDYAWRSQVVDIFHSDEEHGMQTIQVTLGNKTKTVQVFKTRCSTHFSLVNDRCQYGNEYNTFAIECIKKLLIFQIMSSKTVNVYKNVKMIMEQALKMEIKFTKSDETNEDEINLMNRNDTDTSGFILKTQGESSIPEPTYKEMVTPAREISEEEFKNWTFGLIRLDEFEPASDLVSTEDYYQIILDVPGMISEEIKIESSNKETRISGTRVREHDNQHSNIHRKFGDFDLSFKIPPEYNHKFKEATLDKGVLSIKFNKAKLKTMAWNKK